MALRAVARLDEIAGEVKRILSDDPLLKEIALVRAEDTTIFTIYAHDKEPLFMNEYELRNHPISKDLLPEELFVRARDTPRPLEVKAVRSSKGFYHFDIYTR